ncbi:hypothetical protein D3C87_857430 [compost metagenome]
MVSTVAEVPHDLEGVAREFEGVVNPVVAEVTAEWLRLLHLKGNRRIKMVPDDDEAQDCRMEDE